MKPPGGRSPVFKKITWRIPMHSKAQIDQLLRQKSEAVEIPGVVAVAASGKDVIYQGAFGKRDLSKPDNMTTDSVFWIASMTKAITTAAATTCGTATWGRFWRRPASLASPPARTPR